MPKKTGCLDKEHKKQTIIDFLKRFPEGAVAKHISLMTDIDYSTVRGILRNLLKEGIVAQKFERGPYCLVQDFTHGMKMEPKFHNILLQVTPDKPIKKFKEVFQSEIACLRIESGIKSKKITGVISANPPLTHRETCLMAEKFMHLSKQEFSMEISPDDVKFINIEINWDYNGLRLEGCNCITLKSFGLIEKLYNKKECIRHEYRFSGIFTYKDFINLTFGGVQYASIISQNNLFISEQKKIEQEICTLNNTVKNMMLLLKNRCSGPMEINIK